MSLGSGWPQVHRPLTTVEVQLIMQMCDRTSLLRLARCSRSLLQDASHSVAWQPRDAIRLEWVRAQHAPWSFVTIPCLDRVMTRILHRWIARDAAYDTRCIKASLMCNTSVGIIVEGGNLHRMHLSRDFPEVHHIRISGTTPKFLDGPLFLGDVQNMRSIDIHTPFTTLSLEALHQLSENNPDLHDLTLSVKNIVGIFPVAFPQLVTLRLETTESNHTGIIPWFSMMPHFLPKLNHLILCGISSGMMSLLHFRSVNQPVWSHLPSLTIRSAYSLFDVLKIVQFFPRLSRFHISFTDIKELLHVKIYFRWMQRLCIKRSVALHIDLELPGDYLGQIGALTPVWQRIVTEHLAHVVCMHDKAAGRAYTLHVLNSNGKRIV